MLAECLIIPFEALIEAGYPAGKLRLIVLDRDPESSLASWINKLSCRVPESLLVRHYVLATLNTIRVENYARRLGIPLTHYVHEASKEPVASTRALFAHLGLSHLFNEDAVTDWNEAKQLETGNAKVIFPTEPHIYDVPGLHGSGMAYHYRAGGTLSARNLEILDLRARPAHERGDRAKVVRLGDCGRPATGGGGVISRARPRPASRTR
jgi:hypothetical protein